MVKDVLIKKCKSHRYAMRFCAALFATCPIACLFTPVAIFALVGCIPVLLFLPIMLYYETWQIRFGEKEIETSIFWKKKRYSYTQICKASKGWAFSESAVVIRIQFLDKKHLQFRLDDENGEKAARRLNKHCSIKTL